MTSSINVTDVHMRTPVRIHVSDFETRVGTASIIIGANGSGKSTLLDLITGIITSSKSCVSLETDIAPAGNNEPSGRIFIAANSNSFERLHKHGLRRAWQHARLIPFLSICEHMALIDAADHGKLGASSFMRPTRLSYDLSEQDIRIAAALNISKVLTIRAASLSLSEQKRAALLLAIRKSNGPLLLDEPLAGIDASNQSAVMDIVREETDRRPVIICDHSRNLRMYTNVKHRTWFLDNDGYLNIATPRDLEQAPKVADLLPISNGMHKDYVNLGQHAVLTIVRDKSETSDRSHPVLTINSDIRPGALGVSDQCEIEICGKTLIILSAPNGWGKSSLIRSLFGANCRLNRLVLRVGGVEIMRANAATNGVFSSIAGSVPFPTITVEDFLAISGSVKRAQELKLEPGRLCGLLSGGERSLLSAAAALARKDARFVFLDEPFFGTDDNRKTQIIHLIRDLLYTDSKQCLCFIALPDKTGSII